MWVYIRWVLTSVFLVVILFIFELLLLYILYMSQEEYTGFLRWFYECFYNNFLIGFTQNILPDIPQDNVFSFHAGGLQSPCHQSV